MLIWSNTMVRCVLGDARMYLLTKLASLCQQRVCAEI
jgi:hypothetical protein